MIVVRNMHELVKGLADELSKALNVFKIDRSSVLGNPFLIGRDGDRSEVIAKYRIWLWSQIRTKDEVWDELKVLYYAWKKHGDLTLFCWCAPKACHGDVIKSCLEWMDRGTSV